MAIASTPRWMAKLRNAGASHPRGVGTRAIAALANALRVPVSNSARN